METPQKSGGASAHRSAATWLRVAVLAHVVFIVLLAVTASPERRAPSNMIPIVIGQVVLVAGLLYVAIRVARGRSAGLALGLALFFGSVASLVALYLAVHIHSVPHLAPAVIALIISAAAYWTCIVKLTGLRR